MMDRLTRKVTEFFSEKKISCPKWDQRGVLDPQSIFLNLALNVFIGLFEIASYGSYYQVGKTKCFIISKNIVLTPKILGRLGLVRAQNQTFF